MSKQGTLLEKNIERIFKLLDFYTQRNVKLNDYEVDVLAIDHNNKIKIIVECKQYEKSGITVRNLIHLWDSKNKEINADKVILALFGINVSTEDINLAKKYNIELWNEHIIDKKLDFAIENKKNGKEEFLHSLGFKLKKKEKNGIDKKIIKEVVKEEQKINYYINDIGFTIYCRIIFLIMGALGFICLLIGILNQDGDYSTMGFWFILMFIISYFINKKYNIYDLGINKIKNKIKEKFEFVE